MSAKFEKVIVSAYLRETDNSDQIWANFCSVGVCGSRNVAEKIDSVLSGSGKARRSSLPFGVSGRRFRNTGFGTMYSGNRSRRKRVRSRRSRSAANSGTTYPMSRI